MINVAMNSEASHLRQLRCYENLVAGNTGLFDGSANLRLVAWHQVEVEYRYVIDKIKGAVIERTIVESLMRQFVMVNSRPRCYS